MDSEEVEFRKNYVETFIGNVRIGPNPGIEPAYKDWDFFEMEKQDRKSTGSLLGPFVKTCIQCGMPTTWHRDICEECNSKLPKMKLLKEL